MSTQVIFIFLALLLTVFALGGLFFSKLFKTVWLIARVSPYEQTIVGAPTVLILGDSTGYGTGAAKSEDSVAGRLGNMFAVTIVNQSVNGRTIGELLVDAKELPGRYEVILLQIGANDILQYRDSVVVERELRSLITLLGTHSEHIVMMSSGNVGTSPRFSGQKAMEYQRLSREYRAMFLRVALGTDLTYVDLFVEPENDLFVKNPEKYIAWDGLHPSSAGYEEWFKKLTVTLSPLLQKYKKVP